MTLIETTITTLDPKSAIDQIDQEVRHAIDADAKPKREKPAKLTKEELEAVAQADAKAKQAELQALVPWKVKIERDYRTGNYQYDPGDYQQSSEIDRWADDHGTYPRRYRAYSREEWTQAIDQIAAAVNALDETSSEFQRVTGLYVEEHTKDMLLIVAKKWQLQIQVPSTSRITGKRFDLKANPQANTNSYGTIEFHDTFIELLTRHIAGEHRELLLDICCQYLRTVRLRVNRATWAAEHPELAHLVQSKR